MSKNTSGYNWRNFINFVAFLAICCIGVALVIGKIFPSMGSAHNTISSSKSMAENTGSPPKSFRSMVSRSI